MKAKSKAKNAPLVVVLWVVVCSFWVGWSIGHWILVPLLRNL